MKVVRDFDVKNKKVLVRCDFNVPLNDKGEIEDDFRIRQALPTIKYLIEKGAKVILMSHLANNKSLAPVRKRLSEYLSGEEFTLLENLRRDKREEENDAEFAEELAELGNIYINDAFSVCHRTHASIVGLPKYLPSGAGFLLEKEVMVLSGILTGAERPLVVIIGGVKIESKGKVINQFLKKADYLLLGGKIADAVSINSQNLYLPKDKNSDFDIGPKTIKMFSEIIQKAKTVFWAGPLGWFEKKEFETGTKEIAKAITENKRAFKVAGGGDTIFALLKFGLRDKFDHISTGGGAMLKFLSGEKLPGLEALNYYNDY